MAGERGSVEMLPAAGTSELQRDEGSFRDPSGFVVHAGRRVLRLLDAPTTALLKDRAVAAVIESLIADGLLVETRFLSEADALAPHLRNRYPEAHSLLEQRRIAFPSYPSEWTFAMIADAGLLMLEIQRRLAPAGLTLKDASAYNIFFDGARPVFVDIASIEPARHRSIWYAMGQFHRMFLYPLLLAYHRGFDTKGYYLSNIDGLFPGRVGRMLGVSRWIRPGMLLDVTLPSLFSRWSGGKAAREPATLRGGPEIQCVSLRRLRRKLLALRRRYRPRSLWTSYAQDCSYSDRADAMKAQWIETFLCRHRPGTVTDLGCNTGRYSRMAARQGAKVVAVDMDHDSVDVLYRSIAGAQGADAGIQPIWTSFMNPTPAMGFANRERRSFLSRHRAEAVLALALIHHLHVSGRLPLPLLAREFAGFTSKWLIIEYVDPVDPMFRSLPAFREDLYRGLTEEAFLQAFQPHFTFEEMMRLPGGLRTLFAMRKKDGRRS